MLTRMVLTFRFRLLPSKSQHRVLEQILESQRQLYNAALEERIGAYRKAGASMLKVLATMGAVDAQSRDLAGTIGLEIPPVVVPAS